MEVEAKYKNILDKSIKKAKDEAEVEDLGAEDYRNLLEIEKEEKDRKGMKKWLRKKEVKTKEFFGNEEECYVCGETKTRLRYGVTPEEDKFLCKDHYDDFEDHRRPPEPERYKVLGAVFSQLFSHCPEDTVENDNE